MAFTVSDFHDLLRLLRERPEWQAELRRLLLSEELLALPETVRQLSAAVERLAQEFAAFRVETDRRFGELAEAQRRTEAAIAELAEAQGRTATRLGRMETQAGRLRDMVLEIRYRERAPAYLSDLLRRARVLSTQALADLLDEAVERGLIAPAERKDILAADLVVRGRRPESGEEVYLVVEISAGTGLGDVARAVRRAQAFSKVRAALPVVAGESVTPEAEAEAKRQHVACVVDGRPSTPGN